MKLARLGTPFSEEGVTVTADGAKVPVAVILSPKDRENIANMAPGASVYACFPDDFDRDQASRWTASLAADHGGHWRSQFLDPPMMPEEFRPLYAQFIARVAEIAHGHVLYEQQSLCMRVGDLYRLFEAVARRMPRPDNPPVDVMGPTMISRWPIVLHARLQHSFTWLTRAGSARSRAHVKSGPIEVTLHNEGGPYLQASDVGMDLEITIRPAPLASGQGKAAR